MRNASVQVLILELARAAWPCMHCSSLRRVRRRAAGGVFSIAVAQPSLASVRAMWSMCSASHNAHVLNLCAWHSHLVFEIVRKRVRARPACARACAAPINHLDHHYL